MLGSVAYFPPTSRAPAGRSHRLMARSPRPHPLRDVRQCARSVWDQYPQCESQAMATGFLRSVDQHDKRHCLRNWRVCRRCACDDVILRGWRIGAESLSVGVAAEQPGMSALLGGNRWSVVSEVASQSVFHLHKAQLRVDRYVCGVRASLADAATSREPDTAGESLRERVERGDAEGARPVWHLPAWTAADSAFRRTPGNSCSTDDCRPCCRSAGHVGAL